MPITLSPTSTQCTCIIIHGTNVVMHSDEMDITFEDLQLLSQSIEESILFEEESSNICVLGLPSKNTLPTAYEEIPLRTYFARNGEEASMPYFRAKALYESFTNQVATLSGCKTETGEFGADMEVSLVNDGPVTIVLDSEDLKKKK